MAFFAANCSITYLKSKLAPTFASLANKLDAFKRFAP